MFIERGNTELPDFLSRTINKHHSTRSYNFLGRFQWRKLSSRVCEDEENVDLLREMHETENRSPLRGVLQISRGIYRQGENVPYISEIEENRKKWKKWPR